MKRVPVLTCSAAGLSLITSAACLAGSEGSGQDSEELPEGSAGLVLPFCSNHLVEGGAVTSLLANYQLSSSPTLALASLAASASAAMARCSCSGTRTSFTSTLSTFTPQGSVASSKADWKSNVQLPTIIINITTVTITVTITITITITRQRPYRPNKS